ncbi:MAG TPA: DNA-directed RNA polymerase subunit alpha C-terminal domain-containing protein [Planctomycetota bacterium]|nr:DNA-directed RNA polymerase subunit alpha C-terminal domain-containing protein [Planctomycetota bacterium]
MPDDVSVASASAIESILSQPALSAEAILKLRNAAHNSITERRALQSRLNALDGENLPREEKSVRQAAFNWILGRFDQAENATKGLPGPLAHLIKGGIALDRGQTDDAIKEFAAAAQALPNVPKATAEHAAALRVAGRAEDALKVLEKADQRDSDIWLQKGWALEALGRQEESCSAYEKSIELDPKNAQAAFRLAYYMDLRGEDSKAVELYKKVTGQGSAFVNAMINLGLLLEDRDDYDSAIACMKEALKADPTNRRAQLYLRDAVESLDMYYDESQRKESDRLEAILRIPVNDFELSVRSRNCLAKMNVKTLGDMVKKTEPELLAYKNFGETSLREIKQLLESKGLRLGMHKEDEQKRARAQRLRLGGTENTALAKPITDLELSVRSRKCMQRLNIETIGDLCEKSEADLLATKNFGQTSLNEVKQKLGEMGLGLKAAD